MKPKVHNASTYKNWGCRCGVCTEDWRIYNVAARARRARRVASEGLPATVKHGASTYRNWGCRCVVCKAAHAKDARAKEKDGAVTKGEPKVHNANTYVNWKCRCDICKAAWSTHTATLRARRGRRVASEGLPATVEHGVSAYNNWGCRCDICRAAHAREKRAYRKRKASV